jgi:hypothetical protein
LLEAEGNKDDAEALYKRQVFVHDEVVIIGLIFVVEVAFKYELEAQDKQEGCNAHEENDTRYLQFFELFPYN